MRLTLVIVLRQTFDAQSALIYKQKKMISVIHRHKNTAYTCIFNIIALNVGKIKSFFLNFHRINSYGQLVYIIILNITNN